MLFVLNNSNTIGNQFLAELRHEQRDFASGMLFDLDTHQDDVATADGFASKQAVCPHCRSVFLVCR